jgi:hypothetical protein
MGNAASMSSITTKGWLATTAPVVRLAFGNKKLGGPQKFLVVGQRISQILSGIYGVDGFML